MCGIAGLISSTLGRANREGAIRAMITRQRHRGPDDDGLVSSEEATLGMCRLAIIDPAQGRQPMTTPDGRYHLVFNGAIYNHRELRQELQTHGISFRTHCDTEVLLAAYARYGEECLGRLRGMFAFAIWDTKLRTLFAARDPLGIKPLYFTDRPRTGFLFASELNALLSSGLVPREIDPLAAADFLAWSAVPAPRTIYSGISSLLPGHALRLDTDGVVRTSRWWRLPSARNAAKPSDPVEFTREVRSRLEDTIRAHRVADVPVGAFLSGGMDSGAVVALMAHTGANRLKTFSLVFNEAEYSERDAARLVAQKFGTEHHEEVITGAMLASEIDAVVQKFDQPTGDGINTYYVSKVARAGGVRVALSGLGGDEIFGGYPSFRDLPQLARIIAAWRLLPIALRNPVIARLRTRDMRAKKLADFLDYGRDLHELSSLRRRAMPEVTRWSLLAPEVRKLAERQGPYHPRLDEIEAELSGADSFQIVSGWELRTYLADVLLRDSDVFSMAHSLELRVPFVDRVFLEWWWTQPRERKFNAQRQKAALADALGDLLPKEISTRRKMGFTFPFARWMKTDLRPFLEETFTPASITRAAWLDRRAVEREWQLFLARDDSRAWSRIWALAILIKFANRSAGCSAVSIPAPQLV